MPLGAALAAEISRACGRPFRAESQRAASGGCIHRSLILQGGGERWFVKLNTPDRLPIFEAERAGLAAMEDTGAIRVPRPLCCAVVEDHACLVLECLDLQPLTQGASAAALARALAALHRTSGPHFGWIRDNFIGTTPQPNPACDDWPRFFARHRLLPQLQRAAAGGHAGRLCERGEILLRLLPGLFIDYRPQPSLLHGDFWHGNAAVLGNGTPVAFDPAVYWGDRETDLAMSELFGGYPAAFYAAYRDAWPLAEGYETRKTLYNLYHVLNHLNLFGAGYLRQAERMVDRLLAELRN